MQLLMKRRSDENCGVLDDLRFYLESLGEVLKGKPGLSGGKEGA